MKNLMNAPKVFLFSLLLLAFQIVAKSSTELSEVPKPAALVTEEIPAVPQELAVSTRPYMESRSATFRGWNAKTQSMLISTRFGNTNQLHEVLKPLGARTQISFEAEPLSGTWSPKGDILVVSKDIGGNEAYQIFELKSGQLKMLTDGKSRNNLNAFSKNGKIIAYSSTRRNNKDSDIYLMDPRFPEKSNEMLLEVEGGGWSLDDFSPDAKSAVIGEYISITKSNLYLIDLKSKKLTPLGDINKDIRYGSVQFAPDGKLWVTSDEGSDFRRLGILDIQTGRFEAVSKEERWDISSFDISNDGSFIVYVLNEAGASKVKILDTKSLTVKEVELPFGVVTSIDIAPWGEIGFTFSSARSSADAFSIDPKTLQVTRWTNSESGGLDLTQNVEPQMVSVKSFDGEEVSGFLYRPDAKKFPSKRPLLISIHGGPEAQFRPSFIGSTNYLINELGVAVFYPNVRGSSGFGKRFVSLDNGPFKREDSVKDIGAFLDKLSRDPGLDANRFGVTGASYGGYMCYASAIKYGKQLKSANCIVAISNFVTFLENTKSYRRDLRRAEYGDERDPKQRSKLQEISPANQVDRLDTPLLVITGQNDPRVPASESHQIVAKMRGRNKMAWHLIGTNEGHGFRKKENRDYSFFVSLMFYKKTLLAN